MRRLHPLTLSVCALFMLAGCNTEESTTDTITVEVPFSLNALPMPNDGYGYDADGTISLPNEPSSAYSYHSNSQYQAYYQSFETSFAAVDGWGLCVEPIEIPLSSVGSEQVVAINPQSIITQANSSVDTVMLFKEGDSTPLDIKVTSNGRQLSIQCGEALNHDTPTRYHLIVTTGVSTESGQPLQASSEFTRLLDSTNQELNDAELVVKRDSIDPAMSHYRSLASSQVAYAATFTTQDAYSPLDQMVLGNSGAALTLLNSSFDQGRKYSFIQGTLTTNQYLPFDQKTADNDPAGCILEPYDPVASCPAMYDWIKPQNTATGHHLTGNNPIPQIHDIKQLPVDIYLPSTVTDEVAAQSALEQNEAVIFVHGVTADRNAAALMAQEYTDRGMVVLAIDMPYHGAQIVTDNLGQEISAAINKAYFINITSPLTLRSNLHQAIADFIGLRYALNFGYPREVHLIGHSLGGIVSVMISEMTQNKPDLELGTANFVVPGQGLVNLTLSSLLLGPEMERSIKDSPDVQRGIAETLLPNLCHQGVSNKDCIEALEQHADSFSDSIAMLEEEIYSALLPVLKQGVQRTIDSADPAGKVHRQVAAQQATILMEAFGTCKNECEVGVDYISDSVVPNSAPNNELTGTEPLIRALRLDPITDDVSSGNAMKAQQDAVAGMVELGQVTLQNDYFVDSSDFN